MDKREKINRILKQVLKDDRNIRPEHTLVDDLNLTSLQLMEIIGLIENEFNIFVPINQTVHIKTVGDLYRAIESIEDNKDFN